MIWGYHYFLETPIWSIWASFLPIVLWGWWKYLSNLHVFEPSFQNAANLPSIRGGNIGTEAGVRWDGWNVENMWWRFQICLCFIVTPNLGEDISNFTIIIFLRWVGKKPPTRNRYMISSWNTVSKFWLTFWKISLSIMPPCLNKA